MTDIQTWPLNIDFTLAVQNPQLCFADYDLKQAATAKNSRGRVLLWSGNFATVYKLTKGDRAWAVRCFTRIPQADVQHRYQLISNYLNQHQIPYLVNFEFLAKGVLVKGEWYPILKMDWVNGMEIDRYIGEYINDSQVLLRLDKQLQQLRADLQRVGIAHGDLQHGNIMVNERGELKLVDYDGMYVPALRGIPPLEVGHPNYQPPNRSLDDFGDRLDEFSFNVISLSLRALATKPDLWQIFHEDNKNLIFRQNDFQQPESSPVFQSIAAISDDETRSLCDRLIRQCHDPQFEANAASSRLAPKIETGYKDSRKLYSKLLTSLHLPRAWVISLLVISILGTGGWLFRKEIDNLANLALVKPPSPSPSLSIQPIPKLSPSPTGTPIPKPIPKPALTPITVASLLAKYAEGQRDFPNVQLIGREGDRLQGQDLSNINLNGAVIEKLDLKQVILRNANLNGIILIRADLRGADLSRSSLIGANLTASNLVEVNLAQANLLRANLTQTKLGSANLQSAEMMRINLSEADLNAANLTDTNLTLANLRKANFTKANLRDANLTAADLSDANLDSADLNAADLRSVQFQLTNLSNANLSYANLTAATIILSELANTNLSSTNFRQVIVENIGSIEAADFTNALNMSINTRKYFCSLASGIVAETAIATKSTLNCSR
jgi:uncharacterized protein YjbI with pentapeptide repeats